MHISAHDDLSILYERGIVSPEEGILHCCKRNGDLLHMEGIIGSLIFFIARIYQYHLQVVGYLVWLQVASKDFLVLWLQALDHVRQLLKFKNHSLMNRL
jgi:hypothetical protein